ncbi:MAG TPA: SusD/RagB family nutrient-binding outer membrane lipoprotein [Flavipsychrobacter sp.]|nr:SusD/RagB family nutrient-binding outer membrane lipoprotein [Flavipsychrobacter sp.]
MSIKQKLIIGSIIGISLTASSCKKYLDVNKDPNVLKNPTVDVLLPTSEVYIANAMGIDMEINGSIWAQYWTQNPNSSQYRQLEQYQPTADVYDYPWTNLYIAGEDLFQLDKLAASQNKKQYMAIDILLRAYLFQVLTDAFGDVPFTEALRGQIQDGGITSPHYDPQQLIYKGILAYIDRADSLINPNDPSTPGADDLIYGGNMNQWQKFANTLRLRVLMRLSEKDPGTAQAGIAALYSSGAAFLGSGDDAQVNFTTTAGSRNPLYTQEVQLGNTQNVVGSKTCIDSMNSNNDYRAYVFYEALSNGLVAGIAQGNYSQPANPGTYSIPSQYVGADANNSASATAPVKLLTEYESLFLQAEASARGWAPAGMDSSLFYQGIQANIQAYASAFAAQNILLADTAGLSSGNGFVLPNGDTLRTPVYLTPSYAYYAYVKGDTLFGISPAYWSQYPSGGTLNDKLRFIITQKWFSMCGNQGFEAWTEWRRTGYPDFFVISKNSIIGNVFPRRFIYPNTSLTTNLNFPGVKSVTTKVWWDVR